MEKEAILVVDDNHELTSLLTLFLRINAVLRVLQRVATIELATYHDDNLIIDIKSALEKEMRTQHHYVSFQLK